MSMKEINPLSVAIVILLQLSACQSVSAQDTGFSYKYINYGVAFNFDSDPRFILSITDKLVGYGTSFEEVEDCKAGREISCVSSPNLVFAVPNTPIAVGDRWNVNGSQFNVVSEKKIESLGLTEDVFVIVSGLESATPKTFYFSCDRGLRIIVESLDWHGAGAAYISSQEKGLFAGSCGPSER